MSNNFRRDISPTVDKVLTARKQLYENNITGPNYYKPATRPTSYAKIIKDGLTVSTYVDETTFSQVYGTNFKAKPILKKLEVERSGQDASTVNLHLRIRGEFECLDYDDFLQYSNVFCRPDAKNKLTVKFGHVNPADGYDDEVTYTNVFICFGNFASTDQNTFVCSFEAITGGEAVPSIDIMGLGIFRINRLPIKYINDFAWWAGGNELVEVTGVYELLLYDAQRSGHVLTSSYPDGQIIMGRAPDIDYGEMVQFFPKLNISTDGHIAVYKPVKNSGQFSFTERFNKFMNIDPTGTREQEYYSLEYIVARIINQFGIKRYMENYDKGDLIKNALVGFPAEPYSYVPTGGKDVLRSADPFCMLICGGGAGKYLYEGRGKDWDIQVGGTIHAFQGDYIDYRKIMIHRDTIKTIFENAIVNHSQKSVSENTSDNPNDSRILPLKVFCDNLFNFIKNNTGGQINLGLALDDEDPEHLILRVIDLYRSRDAFTMWKFDVLTGDGSTQSLVYRSRLPSNEFHAALIQKISGAARVPDQITGPTDPYIEERAEILKDLKKLWDKKMPKGAFVSELVESARRLMSRYIELIPTTEMKQKNIYVWYLEMSVVMDGVDGWQIGNHITSDNLPEAYRNSNDIGFVVKKVHHIIENNHWRTELEAISTALPSGASL